MKNFTMITFSLLLFVVGTFAQNTKMKANDLAPVEGAKWTGTLTYRDYSSDKKTSIKSDLTVTREAGQPNVWIFEYEYPDEPKANSRDRVILSPDGKTIDGETISEVSRPDGNRLKLVTLKAGTDNGLISVFRFTYEISTNSFSIRKEVKVEGSADYFERNTYSWTRSK